MMASSGKSKISLWGWSWLLPSLAALAALTVIFRPLSVSLTTIPLSGSTNESLGIFAILLSGWLIWEERKQLRNLPIQPDAWGLLLLLLGTLMVFVSYRLVMRFVLGFALVLIASGGVWWLWGRNFVRQLWFPLLLLFAVVPLPLDLVGAIAFRMQTIVARYASLLSGLLGVHVERVGVTLNIPGHAIQVNEACSGWHSFSAAFWLFLLLLYWQKPKQWWQWLWVIPILFSVAILANIFRVTTVVVSAANGVDLFLHSPWHEMLGLSYFLLLVWLLLRYAVKWQGAEASNIVFSAVGETSLLPAWNRVWQLAGFLWVIAGLALLTSWQTSRTVSSFKPPEIPSRLGKWKQTWKDVGGLKDGYWFAQIRYEAKDEQPVHAFLHIPIENRHRPKRLLNLWLGQGYELADSKIITVGLLSRKASVRLVRFVRGQEQQFVAITYLHPRKITTSPTSARWYRMQEQLLRGVSRPWLAIGVAGNNAQTTLEVFRALAVEMDRWLRGK